MPLNGGPKLPYSCNGRAKTISLLLDLLLVLRQLGPGPAGEERLVICNLCLMLLLDFYFLLYRLWVIVIMILWISLATYAWWMPRSFGQLGLVELCPRLLIQSTHTVVIYSSLNHLSTSSMNPTTLYYSLKSVRLWIVTFTKSYCKCANSDPICTILEIPGVLRFEQDHLWQCITGAGTQRIGVGLWRFNNLSNDL